jgi:hypothetical protein
LLGAFGGTWFDDQGNPTFNTGGGVEALKFMRMTTDEGLADRIWFCVMLAAGFATDADEGS